MKKMKNLPYNGKILKIFMKLLDLCLLFHKEYIDFRDCCHYNNKGVR